METSRRIVYALVLLLLAGFAQAQSTDPLPSWNDGAAKKNILRFVAAVADKGGKDFVPPAERIATFDNDGTLWSEQPLYFQFAFMLDQVKRSCRPSRVPPARFSVDAVRRKVNKSIDESFRKRGLE